jgi:NADH-quinone oxidoreductase subunit N
MSEFAIQMQHLYVLMPELMVVFSSLVLLIFGKCFKNNAWLFASLMLFSVVLLMIFNGVPSDENIFASVFEIDDMVLWIKSIMMVLCILVLVLYGGVADIKAWDNRSMEYVIMILLSLLGSMVAVSARSFLILYIALEMIALSGYVIATFDINSIRSTESGTKYFVLGALASCIMLFGISLIYGFANSLWFGDIDSALHSISDIDSPGGFSMNGIIIGIVCFLVGICFKLSLVPFHFWTPDVYQGSPLVSVSFFSSVPKLAIVVVMINVVRYIVSGASQEILSGLMCMAISSIFIGAFGALLQTSLKRMMGYSTIMNLGFVVMSIGMDTSRGFSAAILYQIIFYYNYWFVCDDIFCFS